ncbi:hypothetical protein JXO59_14105, partial [candidate division KSB1 bacterium]|nr:hypothetical protein [candidate division KSB1 bacterium]
MYANNNIPDDPDKTTAQEGGSTPQKPYSKGGMIATGVLLIATIAGIAGEPHTVYEILGYIGGLAALFIRSLFLPLRWWQGILAWLGGLIVGMSPSTLEYMRHLPQASIPIFIVAVGLGVLLLWLSFRKSTRAGVQKAAPTAVEIDLREIRSYVDLFDRHRFGINYPVGLTFLIAGIIIYFFAQITELYGFNIIVALPLLPRLLFIFFTVFLFLAVSHTVRSNLLIPLIFALSVMIAQVVYFAIIRSTAGWHLLRHVPVFINQFLFAAAFVLAVKWWGARLWSLFLCFCIAFLLSKILLMLIWSHGIWFSFRILAVVLVESAITAGLLYLGLCWH